MSLPHKLYEWLCRRENEAETVTICLDDGEKKVLANVVDVSLSHSQLANEDPTDYCIEIEAGDITVVE